MGQQQSRKSSKSSSKSRWDKESRRQYQKDWSRRKYVETKDTVLELLGNKCKRCKISDKRVLCVDHINGGGSADISQKGRGVNYYKQLIELILNGSEEYQLLCHNCNWIKRHENDENRQSRT